MVKAMVRVVKEADVRRTEILDVAQRFFQTKGYKGTSVQTIIDEVGIAKGTFYHYFSSKLDLLDALIKRMFDQILEVIIPIVHDKQLNALEKLERFFTSVGSWKLERKDFLMEVLRVWLHDDNALFRHKLKVVTAEGVKPLLTNIIRQGIAEGVFATDSPDDLAEIILLISQSLSETIAHIVLNIDQNGYDLALVERKVIVYEHAMERVLGAPQNSLHLFDTKVIKRWFD
jgi:AcrR family transcriptional regulator